MSQLVPQLAHSLIKEDPCRCHQCGRGMLKAKRVHRSHKYCETCYARLFKRLICPACENFARLPKFDPQAVCRECERIKPCVRCKRSGLRIGKLTADGPACVSCAHYFREPEPCERCAKPSTRLVRISVEDQVLRCCPACISRLTTSCCSSCRRPRVIVTTDKAPLCERCFSMGKIPCPICMGLMPAGRVKSCEDCTWESSFKKCLSHQLEDISDPRTMKAISEFAVWLKARRGAQFAALNLKRYRSFLVEMHTRWRTIPLYADLVKHATAEGLRRVRSVILWMEESGQLKVDPNVRENASDQRRITFTLSFFPEGPAHLALQGYYQMLEARHEKGALTIRSMRMALGPAAKLLYSTDANGQKLPGQKELLKLLRKRPGLWASLFGFIGYLNRKHACRMNPWIDASWLSKAARDQKESNLLELYKETEVGETYERQWISAALSCFHNLGRIGRRTFQYHLEDQDGHSGFSVSYRDRTYWVPGAPKP